MITLYSCNQRLITCCYVRCGRYATSNNENSTKLSTIDLLHALYYLLFQRGKFRPRLTQMVAENSEDLVKESSREAFKKLPDVIGAISCLTVLKAVGPATASGDTL